MSRSRPEWVSLGLSNAGWAIALPDAAQAVVAAGAWPDASWGPGWARRVEIVSTALAETARRQVRITLAPDLVRCWSFVAPPGTRSLRELRQVAGLQFERMFDEPVGAWAVAGDWASRGASVCTAAPSGLMDGLRAAASGKQWALLDAAPAEARLRNRCGRAATLQPRQPAVWASILHDQATLWWQRQGHVHKVGTLGVNPTNPWPRIAQEIQRVGSLWPDGAMLEQLHWVSACTITPFHLPGLQAVHHGAQAASTVAPSSREHLAASLGVVA